MFLTGTRSASWLTDRSSLQWLDLASRMDALYGVTDTGDARYGCHCPTRSAGSR
jgi:hypothetical protein